MICERLRWLLSFDPTGQTVAHDPTLCRHLDNCPECRAFAAALAGVEEALAARPLAQPRPSLAPAVMAAVAVRPHAGAVEQPFSRTFWLFSAAVTLLALVCGALLLQQSTAAWPPDSHLMTTQLWLNPSWPSDASAWLSLEGERAAQAILPVLAGLLIAAGSAAVGFRASQDRKSVV